MEICKKNKKKKNNKNNKKNKIPKINFTEFKKVNKGKCPSEDASVLLGREKKEITSREGGWDLGGKLYRRGIVGKRGKSDLILGEGKGLKS